MRNILSTVTTAAPQWKAHYRHYTRAKTMVFNRHIGEYKNYKTVKQRPQNV